MSEAAMIVGHGIALVLFMQSLQKGLIYPEHTHLICLPETRRSYSSAKDRNGSGAEV